MELFLVPILVYEVVQKTVFNFLTLLHIVTGQTLWHLHQAEDQSRLFSLHVSVADARLFLIMSVEEGLISSSKGGKSG